MYTMPDDVRDYLNNQVAIFEEMSDRWSFNVGHNPEEAGKYYAKLMDLYHNNIKPVRKTVLWLYPHLDGVLKVIEIQIDSTQEMIH